jgi:hypothetical protein
METAERAELTSKFLKAIIAGIAIDGTESKTGELARSVLTVGVALGWFTEAEVNARIARTTAALREAGVLEDSAPPLDFKLN